MLTGIEIASYGRDLPGKLTLADAVETVAAAAPQMRLRLGSIEPTVITEDFCRRAAATGRSAGISISRCKADATARSRA